MLRIVECSWYPRQGGVKLGLALVVAGLWFLLSCGGSGNSASNQTPSPASNPVPAIVSITPNSAVAGTATFSLAVTGQNFVSSSVVEWNGNPKSTTFSSSTLLQAQISASDLAASGMVNVTVINPAPGGGNSGLTRFVINPASNPLPTLATLNPASVDSGSSGFLLTVSGQNFIPTSTIEWNRSALPTTYLSDTQLQAQVPSTYVAASGFAGVEVQTSGPGGGTSQALPFSINYSPTIVSQSAYDLVWDDLHQLIYLSVPSLAASNGNTVVALNPLSGNIQSSRFAGSEPDQLAISADNQYLYAALDGSSSVQRFTLPDLTPDIRYSLGAVPFFGPTFAWDLQVAPGSPHTTAVSRGIFTSSPYSALGGLTIYDDAAIRPTTASTPGNLFDSLQWGSNTTIYANNAEVTSFDFYVLSASASGVVLSHDYPNVFSNFYISIHYDPSTNRVYGDDGTVVNPANGKVVGSFAASGWMVPDSGTHAAYFLGQTAFQVGTTSATIESFDLTTFAPIAEIVIPNVQGSPLHLIRWGSNGLAFNDDAGYVYIVNDSSFVSMNNARTGMAVRQLPSVQKTRSFPRIVRSSKAVPSKTMSYMRMRRSSSLHDSSGHSAVPNPAPSITSLSPNTVAAGVNGLTLTVLGNNFLSLSTIKWNGTVRPTEFVSSTMLQAQIGPSDVAAAGSASVSVSTLAPGGGISETLPFTILPSPSNHAPILTSLYPNAVPAGSPGFTLDINGYAFFTSATIVEWNDNPRPFTLYGAGQLQLQVSADDVTTPGYAHITVTNPGPGGGTAAADFQILYQPTILNQRTNDMVWDPVNQLFRNRSGVGRSWCNLQIERDVVSKKRVFSQRVADVRGQTGQSKSLHGITSILTDIEELAIIGYRKHIWINTGVLTIENGCGDRIQSTYLVGIGIRGTRNGNIKEYRL